MLGFGLSFEGRDWYEVTYNLEDSSLKKVDLFKGLYVPSWSKVEVYENLGESKVFVLATSKENAVENANEALLKEYSHREPYYV